VGFESKNESFILTIEDDGSGIDQARLPGGKSFGLLGMQERARILGGRVDIHGEQGKGTTITIRIPMQLSTENEATRPS
jgi:signal transduction histidine kinase